MVIAFWGEVRHSSTTTHLRVLADVLSAMCPETKIIIGHVEKDQNAICLLDCGTDLSARKLRLLFRADMIIVSLKQEHACIRRFFEENLYMMQMRMKKEMLILLGGYECEPGVNPFYLNRVYRADLDRISVIPYNNAYYYAAKKGEGRAFIERELENGTVENEQFMNELQKIARRMIRRK